MVPQEQRTSDVTDRWCLPSGVATDCKEELMLRGCESDRGGLFFAPVQEPSQLRPEGKEMLVVAVGEAVSVHVNLHRTTIRSRDS